MIAIVLQLMNSLIVCKDLNTELVLYLCVWPYPHSKVKCLTTQTAPGKQVIQNHSCDPYLATQVFRVVNLRNGFF